MKATSLDFHHDPIEDRLVLTAHAAGAPSVTLTATRRLTRALLGKMVELLMRSNANMSRTPARHREEVLLFEFATALTEAGDRPMDGPPAVETVTEKAAATVGGAAPTMLVQLDFRLPGALTQGMTGLEIRLFDPSGPRVDVSVSRAEAYRLLDLLVRKTREADWGFEELNWIDRRGHVVMPQTAVLS